MIFNSLLLSLHNVIEIYFILKIMESSIFYHSYSLSFKMKPKFSIYEHRRFIWDNSIKPK